MNKFESDCKYTFFFYSSSSKYKIIDLYINDEKKKLIYAGKREMKCTSYLINPLI